MKKMTLVLCFVCLTITTFAQNTTGERILQNAKDKTYQKGEDLSNEAIDKTLNKLEEGVKSVFKKKDKKENSTTANTNQETMESSTSNSGNMMEPQENENSNENTASGTMTPKPVKSTSKFDFVAGEKVLYFDNFERLETGDFPAEFNTNASGEIVSLDDKTGKWLNMTKNGAFVPDNIKQLPENFTLEFEVGINSDPTNNYPGFGLTFSTEPDELMKERFFSGGTSIVYLHPSAAQLNVQVVPSAGSEISNEIKMPQWNTNDNNFAKVSVWRQKGRLRVYVNEDKLVDMPRFFTENKTYDFAFFRSFFDECEVYLTNIRYAVAGEDKRNKLITEGKFVTTGITFDVNSDNIKPESGIVLKDIAATLQENPKVRVKIIGHTDSDGSDAANLLLSQKRAAAVKLALVNFYGIDASRMETIGKGESEPLNKNINTEEKAQNRRVEFIKL
jgi:OOP family OmpA-OmpF porin